MIAAEDIYYSEICNTSSINESVLQRNIYVNACDGWEKPLTCIKSFAWGLVDSFVKNLYLISIFVCLYVMVNRSDKNCEQVCWFPWLCFADIKSIVFWTITVDIKWWCRKWHLVGNVFFSEQIDYMVNLTGELVMRTLILEMK